MHDVAKNVLKQRNNIKIVFSAITETGHFQLVGLMPLSMVDEK